MHVQGCWVYDVYDEVIISEIDARLYLPSLLLSLSLSLYLSIHIYLSN